MSNYDFKSHIIIPILPAVIISTAIIIYIGSMSFFILQTIAKLSQAIPMIATKNAVNTLPKSIHTL